MSSKTKLQIKSQPIEACSGSKALSPRDNLRFVTEFYDESTISGRVIHRCYTHVYSEDLSVKLLKRMLDADQKDNWRFSLWDNIDDLLQFIRRQNDVNSFADEDRCRKYYVDDNAMVSIPRYYDEDNLWLSKGGHIVYINADRISII